MKKSIVLILCVVIILSVFAACSGSKKENDTTTTAFITTTTFLTDEAKVTDIDAVNLIKSYSDEELGLTAKQREKCTFLVANSGQLVEKELYIKVVAAVKHEKKDEETGEVSYVFDYKGEYFIRYDGNRILAKDMKAEAGKEPVYRDLEVKPVPESTSAKD